MNSMLNLPTDILAHEIMTFLSLTDICHFDASLTNAHLRPKLLEVCILSFHFHIPREA